MAQRVVITLKDDIDGSDAVETVRFSLDGRAYEIDLSESHAGQLRERLTPFIKAARREHGRKGAAAPDPHRPAAGVVRAWARSQGRNVPDRGRIPQALYDEFRTAHASATR